MTTRKHLLGMFAGVLIVAAPAVNAQMPPPTPMGLDPVTFQGNTYQVFIAFDITWDDANTFAMNTDFEGQLGHLVTITSAEENTFVDSLRQVSQNPNQFWIGGFQPDGSPEPGGGWQWVNMEGPIPTFSNPVPGAYSNWLGGEPNNQGGGENQATIGIFNSGLWNDSIAGVGAIAGFIVEFEGDSGGQPAGTVDANDCQGQTCNPSGAQEVLLPDSVVLQGNDTLNQLVKAIFIDPRVNALTGLCDDRRSLDVFAELDPAGNLDPMGGPSLNGSLILPEFLCGSRNFAVIRSDASFQVLRDVIRSEQFPETVFPEFYDCDDPAGARDLQERGVFVWSPDETEVPTREGRALELTNDCGSSRGATRELSYFVLNLHIDCGIPFGSDDAAVLQCFIDLTNDKFASLDQSLKDAKKKLISPKYGKIRSQFSSAWDGFQNGNYNKASQRLGRFIDRVAAGDFDSSDGFNYQGDLLMRAENIKFIIDEKINP